MPKQLWTDWHDEVAKSDGWMLFVREGHAAVLKLDGAAVFKDDANALEFVKQRAIEGYPVATLAMAIEGKPVDGWRDFFAMTRDIGKMQQMELDRIAKSGFNAFNGEKVVRSLKKHAKLWIAVTMINGVLDFDKSGRMNYDLLPLRDLELDYWNVSTMFILTPEENMKEMRRVASRWKADTICWVEPEKAGSWMLGGDGTNRVLKLWWD